MSKANDEPYTSLERSEFEDWLLYEEYNIARNWSVADYPYADPAVELAWKAWRRRGEIANPPS